MKAAFGSHVHIGDGLLLTAAHTVIGPELGLHWIPKITLTTIAQSGLPSLKSFHQSGIC